MIAEGVLVSLTETRGHPVEDCKGLSNAYASQNIGPDRDRPCQAFRNRGWRSRVGGAKMPFVSPIRQLSDDRYLFAAQMSLAGTSLGFDFGLPEVR